MECALMDAFATQVRDNAEGLILAELWCSGCWPDRDKGSMLLIWRLVEKVAKDRAVCIIFSHHEC